MIILSISMATETETIVMPVPTISHASGLGYFSIQWKDFGGGMYVTFLRGLGASNAVLSLGGRNGEADLYGRKAVWELNDRERERWAGLRWLCIGI